MSSATTLSFVPITEPEMSPTTPAATSEKRKQSVALDTTPQRSPKMARLDSLVSLIDESPDPTIHYGLYMHDLLKEPANAAPKLVTISKDFASMYEAMRKHAAGQIEANVHWGATKELNTNNLYEILDSRNRILLRYELDLVSPGGEDANGVQIWERASASPAPPVHYGLYIHLHCHTKDGTERFFIGGFKSLGEASFAMRQSAAMYLHGHGGAKLYEKSIEVLNEKGQLQQRFMVEKGRRSENGSFVREADWHSRPDSADSKVPVIRLPTTPEISKSFEPPTAQQVIPQIVPEIAKQATPQVALQVPARDVAEPQAARGMRRQPQRNQKPMPPANKIREKQPTVKSQAKPKALAKPKAQSRTQVQTPRDPNSYCTCCLPDDGSLMIGCDNEKCPVGWYHGRCIGILQALAEEEEWYCEICTRERDNKKAAGMNTLAGKTPVKTVVEKGRRGISKVKAKAKAKAKKRKSS